MFAVAFNHGLRASEVIALKADNVKDGFITVKRLKNSLKTTHPLFAHKNPLLDERSGLAELVRNQGRFQPLFKMGRQHFWRLFQRYAKAAGIPAPLRHPHVLKHSICSQMIQSAGINKTQRFVGHVSIGSTAVYIQADDQEAAEAAMAVLGAH